MRVHAQLSTTRLDLAVAQRNRLPRVLKRLCFNWRTYGSRGLKHSVQSAQAQLRARTLSYCNRTVPYRNEAVLQPALRFAGLIGNEAMRMRLNVSG